MVSFAVVMTVGLVILAALLVTGVAGFREGDRPADAKVKALLRDAGQPDEPRPVVVVTVLNPSGTPALAGLSVRRSVMPCWLGGSPSVIVPFWTTRRGLRASAFDTIGVVPAYGTARLTVPVRATARRYLLRAAIGQAGGRLRLHRLHVPGPYVPGPTKPTVEFGEGLFDLSRTDPASSRRTHSRPPAPYEWPIQPVITV